MPWTIYDKTVHHARMKASHVSKAFGRVLREQRLNMDLSQEALALAADVDRTFVSQMERGIRQPTLTTLFKLAGALNGIAQDRCPPEPAFTVAYLKRALSHLHKSQAALERLAKRRKKLLPEKLVAAARKELFAIREEILKLMDEFRGRSQ